VPKIANGVPMPSDPPHANPTLNGTCTVAAGALVCLSGVCETADSKCGFAGGDGPCHAGNGGTVCRSVVCSTNLTCMPAGGCNADADCAGGNFCLESTHTCTPKLPNGAPVPSDPPHTNPALNGTCTAAAGALVCTSAVCDTTDNKCGYANGDGVCTIANQGTVCRSGVCDPDGACGYAVGDGPCTGATAGTVCRSGTCSSNGTCMPMGGCNVDADCSGGNWCLESAHTCTPKIANGTAIPSDPTHTNPMLNGTCTAAAGTLVCASGVCDPADNKCGLANGDGPCTADAGSVCRSGMCSTTGTCEPGGGCNVDADCMGGNWCSESTHMCTPKLANGTAIPNDTPHMNPALNGTCTTGAGALVGSSGVCDPVDNKCGLANGDGPCVDAGAVCRSGMCSTNGNCEPSGGCNVNADCMNPTPICDTGTHACVASIPDAGPDSGRADSGAPDSGAVDSSAGDTGAPDSSVTEDASVQHDASAQPPPSDEGSLAGGGVSCAMTPANSNAPGGLAAFAGVVLAAGAVTRRRRR
jgi:hypothetical protein